jgi:uncharacterized delta-60 repeat protein
MYSYFNSYYRQLVLRGRSRRIASWVSTVIALACACVIAAGSAQAAGNLDPLFQGKIAKPIGTGVDRAYDMVVQPDGKIVLAGATFNNSLVDTALIRFNSDGGPDPTFNFAQPVVTSFSAQNDLANAVALQADGKIVVAGYATVNGKSQMMIARFNEAGGLDTTFGNQGVVILVSEFGEGVNGLTTQMVNGAQKIVVTGYTGGGNSDFAVVRLNADGSPDGTFGSQGRVVTNVNGGLDYPNDIAIENVNGADKIVVVGYSRLDLGGGSFNDDFAVVRYNSDGTLDNSFHNDGKVITNLTSVDHANAVAIVNVTGVQKIVIGGFSTIASHTQFTVVRYNVDGTLDLEFNGNGRNAPVLSAFDSQILDLVAQPDNKVVAAGVSRNGANGVNPDFAVARFNVDGRLDKTFGGCGTIVTSMAQSNGNDIFYGVGIGDGGRIIAAGHTVTGPISSNNDDFALVGYLANGTAASPSSIDFDGDGRSDIGTFRTGTWYINCSCQAPRTVQFGTAGDRVVPADYDGDGRTDVAVFRAGTWYLLRSSDNLFHAIQWGLADDTPVAADYDGDNRADIAVFRPSAGMWYVLTSSRQQFLAVNFGVDGDIPVPASDNGDSRISPAVFRPSTGMWYISTDPATNYGARQFGQAGDIPLTGDFDGDQQLDLAVFRPSDGNWYFQQSKEGAKAVKFGLATDVPLTGDFDGDTKDDIAVYRNGVWYVLSTTTGLKATYWGSAGDIALGSK